MLYYLLAIGAALPWVSLIINGSRSLRSVPRFDDLPLETPASDKSDQSDPSDDETSAPEPLPIRGLHKLSVVIAARDEVGQVEKSLRSLARQTHPNFEIIIVDDRSTDGTGEAIDRLAQEFPGLIQALHVTELPEGWLGKCNALQMGGEAATGEFILFTDADVEFEETVLERSHRYALKEAADQLAVFPETIAGSFWEKAMLNVFGLAFFVWFRPHRVMVRNSGHYLGIGAFNMVSASMYRKIQGHRFLRLQVVDDVGLGKLVKCSGGTVRLVWGTDYVKVRWQTSLMGTIKGLEKNFFASTNYSVIKTILMVIGVWIMFIWPWFGVWIGPTSAHVIAGMALALQIIVSAAAARTARFGVIHGLTSQFGGLFISIAMLRSMWKTLRRGGIVWRDSFYPLKDIKQFRL